MRIEEKELSANLQNKINIIPDVLSTQSSGLLSTKNGKISVVPVTNLYTLLNKVYTLDDIAVLRNHTYKSEENYISAYDTAITNSDLSFSTLPLLHKIDSIDIFNSKRIYFYKILGDNIYAICSDGLLHIISLDKYEEKSTVDINTIITSSFIYNNFDISTITDIELYRTGLLISFKFYGIYFIDLENNQHSLFAPELDVIGMVINGSSVFALKSGINNNLSVFNEKGLKTYEYNQLSNLYQEVLRYKSHHDTISILADNLSLLHSGKVVHLFKLDDAGISRKNLDTFIPNNLKSNKYVITDIAHQTNNGKLNVRVLGLNNGKVFIRDITENDIYEYNTDIELDYDDILDFDINLDFNYILTKTKAIVFNKNILIYNVGFDKITDGNIIEHTKIISTNDTKLSIMQLPVFTNKNETKIDISALANSNNNDIYVKINDSATITIYDSNDNEIKPNYYIKNTNEHIINICNCNIGKSGYMIIKNIPDKTMIESIVLHKNHIFTK